MKMFFVCFWLSALLAHGATTVGDVILSPATLVDPQVLSVGRDTNGRDFLCYIGRGFDGTPAIFREGSATPLVIETEVPGNQKFGSQFGCGVNQSGNVIYLSSLHPNRTLAGVPVIRVMMKSGGTLTTLLDSEFSGFSAPNPRADNLPAVYTYVQAVRVEVSRSGKLIVAGIFSPPSEVPGAAPIPQFMILEWAGGQWRVLFNNSLDRRTNHFYNPVDYCTTGGGVLYVAAQEFQTDKGAGVYRIKEGKPTLVRNQSSIIGSGLNCGDGGVQVYAADEENYRYSYVADNATSETVFFTGRAVDTVALSSRDTMFMAGPTETYVVANRSLIRVGGGSMPRLIKTAQQAPAGNAAMVAMLNGRALFLQQEQRNQAYWIYRPQLSGNVSGRPGETVRLAGSDLVVEGRLPSLSLIVNGKNVDYSASTSQEIAVNLPNNATEGNYEAIVDVLGIKLSGILTVRGQAEPPAPAVVSVVNGASFRAGPLSPRMLFTVFFGGATGVEEVAGDSAVFELGGVSAFFDDYPARLLYNSGTGQLNGIVPGYAALQSSGKLTVKVRQSGGVLTTSAPAGVTFQPQANTLYQYGEEGVPIVTDEQNRLVGSRSNPAQRSSVVTAFGTGCGQPPDLADDQNIGQEIVLPATPSFTVAGIPVEMKSVSLLPGPAGTCAYKFTVPDSSGRVLLWFGGDMPLGPKYAMWVQ